MKEISKMFGAGGAKLRERDILAQLDKGCKVTETIPGTDRLPIILSILFPFLINNIETVFLIIFFFVITQ